MRWRNQHMIFPTKPINLMSLVFQIYSERIYARMTNLASPGYLKDICKGKSSNILLLSDNFALLVNFKLLLLLIAMCPVYESKCQYYIGIFKFRKCCVLLEAIFLHLHLLGRFLYFYVNTYHKKPFWCIWIMHTNVKWWEMSPGSSWNNMVHGIAKLCNWHEISILLHNICFKWTPDVSK